MDLIRGIPTGMAIRHGQPFEVYGCVYTSLKDLPLEDTHETAGTIQNQRSVTHEAISCALGMVFYVQVRIFIHPMDKSDLRASRDGVRLLQN